MQEIPASVMAAINSRTRAILAKRQDIATKSERCNVSQSEEAVLASI